MFSIISESMRTYEAKLQALRARLQAGEDSPAIEGFDGTEFIAELHKKYPE